MTENLKECRALTHRTGSGDIRIRGLLSGGLKMTESQETKGNPPMFTDEYTLAWMEEHLPELEQSVSGQRILYTSLVVGFVVGLVAQIAGYFLLTSVPSGFLGLLADLLHALGWSLWTGVVVALFVQVIPEVKRRQIRQSIDAYKAIRREKSQAGGNRK
jgi:hypothetical protein